MSKTKTQADSAPADGPLLAHSWPSWRCVRTGRRGQGALWGSFHWALIPLRGQGPPDLPTSQGPHCLISSWWGVGVGFNSGLRGTKMVRQQSALPCPRGSWSGLAGAWLRLRGKGTVETGTREVGHRLGCARGPC